LFQQFFSPAELQPGQRQMNQKYELGAFTQIDRILKRKDFEEHRALTFLVVVTSTVIIALGVDD